MVLYRKYRPQKFSEVVGQEHIVQTITNGLKRDILSHGYLFAGPHGTGKTTLARLLAKSLNCQNRKPGEFEPCCKCDSCLEIADGRAIDLIEIDAASNRGIDDIRELKEGIGFVPAKSKYKVFIIDECLTSDHFITLADGTVKKISEIKNRDKVASVDLKTGNIVEGEVSGWFKREASKTINIKTPQTSLRCTPAHRLWVTRGDEFLLVEAEKLKVGDFLLSPIYLPHIQKNNLSPEQLSLLALIQCDGHVSKDSITAQIEISKDKDYFEKAVREGLQAWQIEEMLVVKETSRGTRLLRVYSRPLKKTLTDSGCPEGKKTNLIDIPSIVFQAPLESIKSYIDTCFCCEGDISPFGVPGNINYRLNFTSGSEIFVKKLQLLLKKFSIGSNVLEIKRKNKKHSTMYRLSLSGYNLRLFSLKIGLTLKRKDKLLREFLKKKEKQDCMPIEKLVFCKKKEKNLTHSQLNALGIYLNLHRPSLTRKPLENFIKLGEFSELKKFLNFRYEKIKKIKISHRTEEVYDFTVKNTHTFVVNGICSSNCHQLSKEAANALLKTLEEPPSHAVFILATTELHKMISTILSRCQTFIFHKLSQIELVKLLETTLKKEGVKYEKEALEMLCFSSHGAARDAQTLLDQAITLASDKLITKEEVKIILGLTDKQAVFEFLSFLSKKEKKNALEQINKIYFEGIDLAEFLSYVLAYLRLILILQIDNQTQAPLFLALNKEEKEQALKLSQEFEEKRVKTALEFLLSAENKIKFASIPQLPLELAILDICQ